MGKLFIKVDEFGLYVRFGQDPVVSYQPFSWGGVYYNASMVIPFGKSAGARLAVAVDVRYGEPFPLEFLAVQTGIEPESFRAAVEPELIRLGWEY
jgi:hypothetical protein